MDRSFAATRGSSPGSRDALAREALTRNELDAICRAIVAETFDTIGIDSDTFIGRERMRSNLLFLQSLREQHEDRGREFRRGLFQNTGNLVAFSVMSMLLLAGGILIGHGFSLK